MSIYHANTQQSAQMTTWMILPSFLAYVQGSNLSSMHKIPLPID